MDVLRYTWQSSAYMCKHWLWHVCDDLLQLGGVEHIQQWAEHRPLRHAEQYVLR